MNLNFDLINKVTEKVDIIIWFSNEPLSEESSQFETMNYLLDGLLTEHLKNSPEKLACTFVHHHFGKKLQVYFYGKNPEKLNITHLSEAEKEFGIILNTSKTDFKGRDYFQKLMKWVEEVRY